MTQGENSAGPTELNILSRYNPRNLAFWILGKTIKWGYGSGLSTSRFLDNYPHLPSKKLKSVTATVRMFDFNEARAAVEAEGVYIGGWSLKQAIMPSKKANGTERDP